MFVTLAGRWIGRERLIVTENELLFFHKRNLFSLEIIKIEVLKLNRAPKTN